MRLVTPDLAVMEAAVAGDAALAAALGCAVAPGWSGFPDAVARVRDRLAADARAARWGSRLFLDAETLVGWGGFKGPPDADGAVELGYAIAPSQQNRGLATAAVGAMLAEALADAAVTHVVAHTLPERNASVRVLERSGFQFAGERLQAGQAVWRFARRRDGGA